MPLNLFLFLTFFLGVLVIYWIMPPGSRKFFLLAANIAFCSFWDWRVLILLTTSVTVDYFIGLRIGRLSAEGDRGQKTRRALLIASLTVQLLMLGIFKYFNFFSDSLGHLLLALGISVSPVHLNLFLPVGISFYTFKTITYTVDIYKKRFEPTRSYVAYAIYLSFFPSFLSGPIDRAKFLLPRISEGVGFQWKNFQAGAHLIFVGLLKKIYVADNLAGSVQRYFSLPQPGGWDVLWGAIFFYFQLYADFSGYTDIALGSAQCLGYQLTPNFNRPYLAKNPADFWQRWHISLSTWLRDYLFLPLGGAFRSPALAYRNLAITMVLAGLWHGASITFVIWGGYIALLLIGYRILQPKLKRWGRAIRRFLGKGLRQTVKIFVTFLLIGLGWIIFRAESWATLKTIASGLFRWPAKPDLSSFFTLAMFAGPLVVLETVEHTIFKAPIYRASRLSFWIKVALYAIFFYLFAFKGASVQSFIYAQF